MIDPSINALVSQSQKLQQQNVQALAQIKLFKGAIETQGEAVLKLIDQSGLQTYTRNGEIQSVPAVGTQVNLSV